MRRPGARLVPWSNRSSPRSGTRGCASRPRACGCCSTRGCPGPGRSSGPGSRSRTTSTCPGRGWHGADLVVVSHEHLDHLDLDFLAQLPARVPIVVPRYPSTIIQRRLAAAGREQVIVLDAWERVPLRPRRLAHGDPGAVPDEPRRGSPGQRRRLLRAAHERRPDLAGADPSGHRPRSGGPLVADGGADVRSELAPGLLRLPAPTRWRRSASASGWRSSARSPGWCAR